MVNNVVPHIQTALVHGWKSLLYILEDDTSLELIWKLGAAEIAT